MADKIDLSTLEVGNKMFLPGVTDWNTDSRVYYDQAVAYGKEHGTQYQFDRELNKQTNEYRWFVERIK